MCLIIFNAHPKVVPDERKKQISFALQGKALEQPKADE
jgi:hypothetical protein